MGTGHDDDLDGLARSMLRAMARLEETGLNEGSAGNLSVRLPDGFLITPTGSKGPRLAAGMMVRMGPGGRFDEAGPRPSSEWRIHDAVYAAYPGAGAVVHTHSPHATALACLGRGIPAFHYTVALAGGTAIPCAPYATFGGETLSRVVVAALADTSACLLANHGVITYGGDLDAAVALAAHVEYLARVYLIALQAGAPVLLDETEMRRVMDRISTHTPRPGD